MQSLREVRVERALREAAKNAGGIAMKFVSPGLVGAPDRIVVLPCGLVCFVEVKAPGERPRPAQRHVLRRLYHLGANVATVDNETTARRLVELMRRRGDAVFSA